MMRLSDFINEKKCEYTNNIVGAEVVKNAETLLGVPFGEQLTEYILKYGYLAYKHVEFYGINSNQKMKSDMITQTEYLHKYYVQTVKYIALGNLGDGYYVMISSNDEVYEYSSESDILKDTNMKLFDYILKYFREID